jgi:hypothetical protein
LKSFKIKSPNLYHFEIGFEHISDLDDKTVKVLRRAVDLWMKEMKRLGTPVRALRVFDMLKKSSGYYLHFHFASLPVGDVRKFGQNCHLARENMISKGQTPFIVRIEGYRPKKAIFDYFSKRMAGTFGHECKGTAQTFSDMMSLEQYFEVFFRSKHLYSSLGWKALPDSNLVRIVLSCPKICPHCSHNTFSLISNDYLGEQDHPPPP